jgi:hypothetical protein
MFKDSRGGGGAFATERSFRLVPLVVVVATLCAISFYLGNQVSERSGNCLENIKVDPFPECNITFQDYTPCTDPKVNILAVFQFEVAVLCFRNGVTRHVKLRHFLS